MSVLALSIRDRRRIGELSGTTHRAIWEQCRNDRERQCCYTGHTQHGACRHFLPHAGISDGVLTHLDGVMRVRSAPFRPFAFPGCAEIVIIGLNFSAQENPANIAARGRWRMRAVREERVKAIYIGTAALAMALAVAVPNRKQSRPGPLPDPHRQADSAISARRRRRSSRPRAGQAARREMGAIGDRRMRLPRPNRFRFQSPTFWRCFRAAAAKWSVRSLRT